MNAGLLNAIVELAQQAGAKIMEFYTQEMLIQKKADSSPVTAADLAAHDIIAQGLKQLTPDLPVLSEESAALPSTQRQLWQSYWLVDPLDGTRDFLEKNGEFTVNIALIEKNRPVLGVVYAPALATLYFAVKGEGAFKQVNQQPAQKIHVNTWKGGKIRVAASRHHGFEDLNNFLVQLKDYTVVRKGSALKFGLVAEGAADIYPRLSPTSEWDTAAGQCVLEEAGGAVLDKQGLPLQYNRQESLINPSFLAVGDVNISFPIFR